MAMSESFDRRTLFRGGLAVTAAGALTTIPATVTRAAPAESSAVQEPRIHGTAAWDARPPNGQILVRNHKPTYIVVHHTVEPGNTDDYSKERAFWASRFIQDMHMDRNGWIDSGQQFTISRGGYITEGRHRSLEILREGTRHVQGANVGGHNDEVIGIENEGLYVDVDVTQALWDSLVELVAYIADQYSIDPVQIAGHRDFNSTQCPGDVLYGRLPELRTAVGERLGVSARQPDAWPLLTPGDRGPAVLTAQRLLRERGARDVPVDGVFGPATRDAVSAIAAAHGLAGGTCHASACADETGFLGADIWPLITTDRFSESEWKARLAG